MSDPLTSRRLGRYMVEQEIGRGGMARVYRAVDTLLQRTVALKILAPQLSNDPEFARRFEHEAVTAANLRHPAIITIFDVGEAAGLRYIAMEYIGGATLSTALSDHGAFSLPLAVAVLQPIAEALDAAHQLNAVHRDIKPQNILLDTDGRVLLTDFGIALGPQQGGERITRAGSFMGTPEYLSPEQVQGQQVTGASDLYALGVVAFELLTGRIPFEGSTPELIVAHAYTAAPAITSVAPHLPAELDAIFTRALAKDPTTRYATALAFVEALHAVAVQRGLPATTRQGIAALTQPAQSSAGHPTIAMSPPSGTPQPTNPAVAPSTIEDVFGTRQPAAPAPVEDVFGQHKPRSPIEDVFAPPASGQPRRPTPATTPSTPRRPTPAPQQAQTPSAPRQRPTGQRQPARTPTPPNLIYPRGDDSYVPPRGRMRSSYPPERRFTISWPLVMVALIVLVLLALLVVETSGRRATGNTTNGTNGGLGAVFAAVTPTTQGEVALATPVPGEPPTPVPTALAPVPPPQDTTALPAEPTEPLPPTEEAAPIVVPTIEPVPTAEPTLEPTLEPTAEPTSTPEPTTPPTAVPPTNTPLGRPTAIGDGSTIVFQLDDGIELFDSTGQTEAAIQADAQPIGPAAISPDGTTILFDAVKNGERQIYQWTKSNRTITRYTQSPGNAYHPAWSPDGTQVVYAGSEGDSAEIYLIEADGIRRLTNDPGEDDYPSWTPDGAQIVWESSRSGQWGIWLMNDVGAQQIVDPVEGANDRYPRISPDGTQVVFASDRDRNDDGYELYVQSLAGGSPVRLTRFENGSAIGPQWSPDGSLILFFTDKDGTDDIYIVRLDDGAITLFRNSPTADRWPVWGR